MDLGGYPAPAGQVLRPEGLMPEETMNPVLTSLVNFLGRKCINPEQAVGVDQ